MYRIQRSALFKRQFLEITTSYRERAGASVALSFVERIIKQAVELIPDGGQLQARQHPVEVVGKIGQHHQAPPATASYSLNGRSSVGTSGIGQPCLVL